MANIIPLKEESGAQFYPQTHEKAIIDSNGVNLQTKLANITTPSYVTAWDGVSTPVVANIPAGVVVTYNSTDYTGTLAASASTLNKTYLVATGTANNYYRYVTELSGSSYSWHSIGTTEINLSDYATKEELSQLSQIIGMEDEYVDTAIKVASSYINDIGQIASSNNFQVSAPIRLQKGQKIVARLGAYSICATISLTDAGSTNYTPVVMGTGATLASIDYEYVAVQDCYVALCGYVSTFPASVSITGSAVVNSMRANLNSLNGLLGLDVSDNIAPISAYSSGKYINVNGGVSTIANESLSFAKVRISGVKKLHYKGTLSANTYIGLYSGETLSAGSLVSMLLGGTSTAAHDTDIDIPQNGEYWLGISGYNVSTTKPTMSILEYYETEMSYFDVERKVDNERHLYVGATRDIKTLFAAFELLGDGTPNKKNIIHLDAETYDVFAGVDLSEQTTSFRGLDVPNYTYLVGQGVDKTVIMGSIATGYSNLDYNNISTLNMEFVGGCKDLTIQAHNLRYCIHSDAMRSNDQELRCDIRHENVKFYHDGLDSGIVATGMAYGLGCRSLSRISFKDCDFINNESGRVVFNLHNNQSALLPSFVEFVGCSFQNLGYNNNGDLSIMSEGTENADKVEIRGCKFNGGILLKRLSGVSIFDQEIVGGGNSLPRIYVEGGVGVDNLSLEGFEKMYAVTTFSPGDAVSLLTFNRADKASNKKMIYGVALTSATNGNPVVVQTYGLIPTNIIGISASDGSDISLVNGKLAVSSADPIGVVVCGGNYIKLRP